jgi:hypothetical protein
VHTKPGKRWAARRKDDGTWELVPPRPKSKLNAEIESRPKPPYPDDTRDSYSRNVGGNFVG